MCFVNRKSSCWPNKIIQRTHCFFAYSSNCEHNQPAFSAPSSQSLWNTSRSSGWRHCHYSSVKKRSNPQVLFNKMMKDWESINESCIYELQIQMWTLNVTNWSDLQFLPGNHPQHPIAPWLWVLHRKTSLTRIVNWS